MRTRRRLRSSAARSSCFIRASGGDPGTRCAAGRAVAQARPRRGARTADAAAADRRILDLRAQLADDALGRGLLERRSPFDRDARDARVLQREPAEDRRLARGVLGLLEARSLETLRIEDPADHGVLRLVAGERRGERCEEREPVLVDRSLREPPDVLEREVSARVLERVAHRVEPQKERLDRLDLEPAVAAPEAQRSVPPRVERRLELIHTRDVEIGELRAEAAASRRRGSRGARRRSRRAARARRERDPDRVPPTAGR